MKGLKQGWGRSYKSLRTFQKVSEKKSMPGTVGKRTGESKMNEMRKTSEVLLESPASLGAQARCLRERDAERIVHGLEEAVLFWGGWF